MFKNSAWMLILAVIVLLAGVVGCASDKPSKSTRSDSPYASGVNSASSGGSCH
jgi:hypothetical protein